MCLAVTELPLVAAAVGAHAYPLAVALAIAPLAFVAASVVEDEGSLAMGHAVLRFALVEPVGTLATSLTLSQAAGARTRPLAASAHDLKLADLGSRFARQQEQRNGRDGQRGKSATGIHVRPPSSARDSSPLGGRLASVDCSPEALTRLCPPEWGTRRGYAGPSRDLFDAHGARAVAVPAHDRLASGATADPTGLAGVDPGGAPAARRLVDAGAAASAARNFDGHRLRSDFDSQRGHVDVASVEEPHGHGRRLQLLLGRIRRPQHVEAEPAQGSRFVRASRRCCRSRPRGCSPRSLG